MVALNLMEEDPTLVAMHKAVEAIENSKPRRTHLGCSSIGHYCERYTWLSYNYPDKGEPISYKGLYAIEDGHRTEQLMKDRLRLVPGIQLWDIDETTKQQIGFLEGKFGGSVDGIILGILQAPKTVHIFESKACNEKKFKELNDLKEKFGEKNALQEWDYTYFAQAQLYMGKISEHYGERIDRHYLVCATPGGRDFTSCRTEFQPVVYNALLQKKDRILTAKSAPPRITENQSFYKCKFCRMKEFCWSMES